MLSFLTLNGATVRADPAPTAVRDDDIFQEIVIALRATGEFDGVHYPSPSPEHGFAAGEIRSAVLTPIASDWDSQYDDGLGAADVIRNVMYTVTVAVREPDPVTRAREFDRLANVVSNALDGKSLAGVTLPALTGFRSGRVGRLSSPEQQITLTGNFTYFVDGWSTYDETT